MTTNMRRPVSLIAACSLNRVIGRQGKLPWRLPCDWSFFCAATHGQVLIMGRRSFEELSQPLADRHTIVVSPSRAAQQLQQQQQQEQSPQWTGVAVVSSLDEAIELANADATYAAAQRVFVAGGERLYGEAIERELVESCYVTRVHAHIDDGDAFLPKWTHRYPRMQYASSTMKTNGTSISFGVWTK